MDCWFERWRCKNFTDQGGWDFDTDLCFDLGFDLGFDHLFMKTRSDRFHDGRPGVQSESTKMVHACTFNHNIFVHSSFRITAVSIRECWVAAGRALGTRSAAAGCRWMHQSGKL